MFSKSCEYGIRAIVYVAYISLKDRKVSLKEIAEEIDSPVAFTAKIMQQMTRANLILSMKGPFGGFQIEQSQLEKITLYNVISTIDGDKVFNGCGLGLKQCNANKPCPFHSKFESIRESLKKTLLESNLKDLAQSYQSGLTHLKR